MFLACGVTHGALFTTQRVHRGYLMGVFKIMKGINDVDLKEYFTLTNTELRGHEVKFHKPRFICDARINCFFTKTYH